jgi:hypothetical protein
LGHGEEAQIATANLATHVIKNDGLVSMLEGVDRQLAGTRGAVAVAAELNVSKRELHLLGVGDMHAHICEEDEMNHVAFSPGILGREHRTMTPFYARLAKGPWC